MVIGFHYHLPIRIDGDGTLHTQSFYGLFLDALSQECRELVVFTYTPVQHELTTINYQLTSSNIRAVNLGPHSSLPSRLLRFRKAKETIEIFIHEIDIFLIRTPTPLLSIFASFRKRRNVVMYIVGDFLLSSSELTIWRPKTWLIKLLGLWFANTQKVLAKDNMVIANNEFLLTPYKKNARKTVVVKSTTLTQNDIFIREDTCQGNVIRVLYTGRIDPAKGLFEILQACELLSKRGLNLEFHLAGLTVKGFEKIPQQLIENAENGLMKNRVILHGLKKVGVELNALYRTADIYIIASKGMEGFPRTVWEAMANGLPVIASNLGAIPLFLRHRKDALLITPGGVNSAAEALLEVMSNQTLRQTLLKNGYALAYENTLDKQAVRMAENLRHVIREYE